MNHYELRAVLNGNDIYVKKIFASRRDAINYAFRLFEKNYIFNFQVNEERELQKHNIEYYEDNYNRFSVARI